MDEYLRDVDHDDAWRRGSRRVDRCRAAGIPGVISIHIGEQRVFHAGLPGSSASNDAWVDRTRHSVRRFDRSSRAVYARYVARLPTFYEVFALPPADFAAGRAPFPCACAGRGSAP